ncbi:MAG: hypothetical protein LUE24_08275 [Lachnospiraceae bacterium]|nr:hypothetical protein [Lachnospiraceae bacterium]
MDKKYTPAEMDSAKRLADVIASVPAEKQPEIIRMIEAMILGAEMAEKQYGKAQ